MPVVVRRALAALLAVAVAAVTAVALPPGSTPPAGAQAGDFYTPPSPLPAGRNGDVIKSQPFTYAGAASATRIMYLSRDIQNRPMPVTGTVIVPSRAWSGTGPRPIVAYAPFTAGLGDQCAASHTIAGDSPADLVSGVQTGWVNALLNQGIAVAQTDYQGLGTPGDHTYVMRVPQAQAVLDVIRAAQRLPSSGLPTNGPVGIAGYSQGGGASAAAAELAPTYAPELNIQGVYAGAPVADLRVLASSLDGSMYVAFLGYALIGSDAAYDTIDLNVLANDQGRAMLTEARTTCTLDAVFRYMFRQTSTLTITGQPVSTYLSQEPFNTIVEENKLGKVRPLAPVLVEHSWIDDVLPQAQAKQMARDWCGLGANVQWRDIFTVIPLFTHLFEANTAANNAANWLAGRFRGTAATPNCGQF